MVNAENACSLAFDTPRETRADCSTRTFHTLTNFSESTRSLQITHNYAHACVHHLAVFICALGSISVQNVL